MARIAGVDLPRDKRIEAGLTYIYGIGFATSQKILKETGVDPDIRVKDLTDADISKLMKYIVINNFYTESFPSGTNLLIPYIIRQ